MISHELPLILPHLHFLLSHQAQPVRAQRNGDVRDDRMPVHDALHVVVPFAEHLQRRPVQELVPRRGDGHVDRVCLRLRVRQREREAGLSSCVRVPGGAGVGVIEVGVGV